MLGLTPPSEPDHLAALLGLYAALAADEHAAARATLAGDEPLPAHLRAVAPLEPPERAGGQAFLDGPLAPARSGLLLTRADPARELGLGGRVAERRYALRNLLGQDAAGTLGWLEGEAARAARHPAAVAGTAIAAHWSERAAATATALAAARAAAIDAEVTHAG